jgi:hypothetical protein
VVNDLSPLADTEVLYLTDANGYFGGAVDLIRSMQLSCHLPPLRWWESDTEPVLWPKPSNDGRKT